jgi:ABC-2 type transport system permease protein
VLLPVAIAFLSTSTFNPDGIEVFVDLVETLHLAGLTPLLALFFATMLLGEEVEGQTIPYILTRPIPRSAWILGKFFAYLAVVSSILIVSIALTYLASATLNGVDRIWEQLDVPLQYAVVAVMALMSYGAFTLFLGTVTRRPIVYGVVFLYGWQNGVKQIPGVVDFLSIQKYIEALYPVLPTAQGNEEMQAALSTFKKQVFLVGATKAAVVLVLLTAFFLGVAIFTVRKREYASARAIGS